MFFLKKKGNDNEADSQEILDTQEPLTSLFKNIIGLAEGEADKILTKMLIRITVEFTDGDGGDTDLGAKPVAHFKITTTGGDLRREGKVLGDTDAGSVDQEEIGALGKGVGETHLLDGLE